MSSDIIKGNESYVGNIDFELQADKFLSYIVLNLEESLISPQPDVQLKWDLDQNVAF